MQKSDFPLLANHPEIIYLDNAATTQKPAMVIDGVSRFIQNDYANIHRGLYSLSENSELHYHNSKKLVSDLINCTPKEIIYTANATASFNLLAQSLVNSGFLGKGDAVLVGIRDHHANTLPWMSLAKQFGFEVRFFGLNNQFEVDYEDFQQKYTPEVKVVSCGQVSNVTGGIYDVKKIWSLLREDTFFVVDASQSIPNMPVDMQEINCDALIFTAHKIMAYTGLGVLALKHQRVKELQPLSVGGGTIKDVSCDGFELQSNNEKFEAWTPNIIGAVSLEYALEYLKTLSPEKTLKSSLQIISEHEKKLAEYALGKFHLLKDQVKIIGPISEDRVALFSFIIKGKENFNQVWEFFAERNICIRCGGHCAYPLHKQFELWGTCRMSAYLYNDISDLDTFFKTLKEYIAQ